MMTRKLTNKELEVLSAYLDKRLTVTQVEDLKIKLAHDTDLRQALEELRLTRYALRRTPQVRRTRNFVLTPEMVHKQRSTWRALRVSRTVSAVASLMFVFVFTGQMLFSGPLARLASAPMVRPPIGGGGGFGQGGGPAGDTGVFTLEPTSEPTSEPTMEPTVESLASAQEPEQTGTQTEPPAIEEIGTALAPMPSETPSADRVPGDQQDSDLVTEEPAGSAPALEPTAVKDFSSDNDLLADEATEKPFSLSSLQVVEALLLGLAALGGGLALFFNRRLK